MEKCAPARVARGERIIMQERPILFKSEMVRAVWENRKTQIRRIIKPQPSKKATCLRPFLNNNYWKEWWGKIQTIDDYKCPYGVPGDRLWVRETWCSGDDTEEHRIVLEITDVRAERVQDISKEDAVKEGVPYTELNNHRPDKLHIGQFADLWDSCYGRRAWERNDWVWVIEFKLLTEGKDELDY